MLIVTLTSHLHHTQIGLMIFLSLLDDIILLTYVLDISDALMYLILDFYHHMDLYFYAVS